MYKKLLIVSAFLFFMLVMLSCGDDSVVDSEVVVIDTTQVPELYYVFADYIHFDTSGYILVETFDNFTTKMKEPFLYYEKNLGEPFTDINGNGIYDPGVDLFIRAIDSTNQDLNHNGFHDGPDDWWSPGVPFDDVNGDGEFLYDPGHFSSGEFIVGAPYFDLNKNNRWDSLLDYNYIIVNCSLLTVPGYPDYSEFRFFYPDSLFLFQSDSGVDYFLQIGGGMNTTRFMIENRMVGSEILNDFGIYDNLLDGDSLIYNDSVWTIPNEYYPNDKYLREHILGATLSYKDTLFEDLLLIRFSKSFPPFTNLDTLVEFYFDKEYGLICYHLLQDIHSNWKSTHFFLNKIDSIPLLMTKP